jgi:hypothetical protein
VITVHTVKADPIAPQRVALRAAASLGKLAAFAAFSLLVACGGSQVHDPQSVLRAYARALDEGRADDAYRMLSEDARRNVSREAFRRMVKESPEDARDIAQALVRGASAPVVTATVTTASGETLELVLEGGAWKLDATAVNLYAQDTPRHAILGFVRAVERRRYDIVLKFVPDAHREGLDASKLKAAWEGRDKDEIAQVLSGLRQALPSATIEETGDRATLAYSQGTMQLVREHGLWKIEDFD